VREAADLRAEGPLDEALVGLTEIISLAPWWLDAEALDPLRAAGLSSDAAVFDVIALAAFTDFASRLRVALAPSGARLAFSNGPRR